MSSETSKAAPSARPGAAAILFLLCLAGVGLRASLSLAMRAHAPGPAQSAAFWGWSIAAATAAAAVLVAFVALLRMKEEWMLYLGAAFLFILLYKSVRYRPEIAPVELPLALFLLVPAALFLTTFLRRIRHADELERRILGEALAIAFAIALAATLLYATGEGALRFPRIDAAWWSALLVASCSVGLIVARHRYARRAAEA